MVPLNIPRSLLRRMRSPPDSERPARYGRLEIPELEIKKRVMKNILTVSALNEQIKGLLEESFPFLWVEGEISNLSRPASGHLYFTLKDKKSQIRAVIFRALPGQGFPPQYRTQQFDLENGMSIVCRARISVYQPRGEYQLLVDTVVPKGAGALQKAFEQLKARLQAEGLFDAPVQKTPSLPPPAESASLPRRRAPSSGTS